MPKIMYHGFEDADGFRFLGPASLDISLAL